MSDIFREVDQELKQERYALLWKKYGHYVLGLAVVLVLGVAGYQGWDWYRSSVRMSESARFVEAMELVVEGRQQDALGRFEALAADSSTGYEVLARFRAASLRRQAGDGAGALSVYEEIVADESVDDIYRQLANLLIALDTLDEAEPAALQERLEPLARPGAPWRHTAREALAALALRRGNAEDAAGLYRELSDDGEAPQGIRARAAEMLAIIGQKG
ncbi:MAG: tetratricopeptide repeat protein [Acetobacterales bacterium]